MAGSFQRGLLTSFLDKVQEHGEHAEQGGENISEFIMHHVQDHVIYPIHLFGVDLSITKHVVMIWIAAAILAILLPLIIRSRALAPKGPVNFIEWIIVFLKDAVIDPYLGEDGYKYAPYLLTAFFFIITLNLLGLVPMAATATGNISVTAAMALLTLFLVQFSSIRKFGFRGYIKSFVPPGLPGFVVPIIFIVEIMGMITKHFALAMRLFANMFAGHLVIFTLLGLIFLFKNILISPFPIFGILFVSLLEILIALIQAYIFTILSAVFIGAALHPQH
jgi:F-type H+-transporting ATPase subunit a